MPEPDCNNDQQEFKGPLEDKAWAQIAWWDQYGEDAPAIYYVYTCAVCRRRRSQKVLIYMATEDIFLCSEEYKEGKEGCFSKAWTKLPHDKRWDE